MLATFLALAASRRIENYQSDQLLETRHDRRVCKLLYACRPNRTAIKFIALISNTMHGFKLSIESIDSNNYLRILKCYYLRILKCNISEY